MNSRSDEMYYDLRKCTLINIILNQLRVKTPLKHHINLLLLYYKQAVTVPQLGRSLYFYKSYSRHCYTASWSKVSRNILKHTNFPSPSYSVNER